MFFFWPQAAEKFVTFVVRRGWFYTAFFFFHYRGWYFTQVTFVENLQNLKNEKVHFVHESPFICDIPLLYCLIPTSSLISLCIAAPWIRASRDSEAFNRVLNESVKRSINDPINRPVGYSISRSDDKWINKRNNHAISQSISQLLIVSQSTN